MINFDEIKEKAIYQFDENVKNFNEILLENPKYPNLADALMKLHDIDHDNAITVDGIFFALNHPFLSSFGHIMYPIITNDYLNLPYNLTEALSFIDYNITDDGNFSMYKAHVKNMTSNKITCYYFIDTSDFLHEENKIAIENYINRQNFFKDNKVIKFEHGDFQYDIDKFTAFVNMLCDNASYDHNHHLIEEKADNIIKFTELKGDE